VKRREFLLAGAAAAIEPGRRVSIPDPLLAEAYEKAARQNVLAAVNNKVFFGYFSVCADGKGFGYANTYPSLDGHQLSDALLRLDQVDVVKANWDYVRRFQKPNGLLPIAIFPNHPKKVGEAPVDENGGFYTHWVKGNPLRALGATTFVHNAEAIFRRTSDTDWLRAQMDAVNLALKYLESLTTPAGRVGGAGYYVERPPRIEWDGVTQCHAADAFARAAALNRVVDDEPMAQHWEKAARRVTANFQREFWTGSQCVEYIHPERGPMASHGLTDVDWAALALNMLSEEQRAKLWPQMRAEKKFYYGGMPTGIATEPTRYEPWEFGHDNHDLAAMGRVWYLECAARAAMGDADGLVDSLHRVAEAGKRNGYYWRERYLAGADGTFAASGPNTYCEYPANLVRTVHRHVFGVEFGLDGVVTIAPTAPKSFYREGFGETIATAAGELEYRVHAKGVSGRYRGTAALRLRVKRGGWWVRKELAASGGAGFEL
jgi:hypothetical protein